MLTEPVISVIQFRHLTVYVKICVAALLGMLLLLLSSDWWLPKVLPAVLRHWDVRVASLERLDQEQWELLELQYAADGMVVRVDAMRVPSVWRYVRARWQAADVASLRVELRQLTVELGPAVATTSEPAAPDIVDQLNRVRLALSTYAAWLPALEIDRVLLRSEQGPVLTLHDLSLRDWQLALRLESPHLPAPMRVAADIHPDAHWRVRVNAAAMPLQLAADCRFDNTGEVAIGLTVWQHEQVLRAQAVWRRGERMPHELLVQSAAFSIRSDWFAGLDRLGIRDLRLAEVDLSYGQGAYHGRFALAADLAVESNEVLALQARGRIAGDAQRFRIEACELDGAWGELTLSNPLHFDLRTRSVVQGAEWSACLDLAQQPWIPAQGQLHGRVTFAPDDSQGLNVRFDLRGADLKYATYAAEGVTLAGDIRGSTITLQRLQLDLLEDTDADRVLFSGVADWAKRSMELDYCAALGSKWLNAQLGSDYFADELTLSGRVFGDFDRPQLEGMLAPLSLRHPALRHPVTVAAELRCSSAGGLDLNLSASCQNAMLVADVALTNLQPMVLGHVEVHAQSGGMPDSDGLLMNLVGRFEREGIRVDQVTLQFAQQALLSGCLALPIRLHPVAEQDAPWSVVPGGSLSADLSGQTSSDFSQWLTELSGVRLEEASLALGLSGWWDDPGGLVDVQVAKLDLGGWLSELELPVLTELTLAGRIDADVWALEQFECRLNQSRVTATAALPSFEIGQAMDAWAEPALALKALLQQLSARIELTDWKFANWLDWLPRQLRQSGELNGSLLLQPGLELSGQLLLDGFALRPTQAYSTIDQIGAELELADHTLSIKQASARVGGSPVSLTGWIDGTDLSTPLWDFTLQGQQVPLVRTTDLIIRSDVDLSLQRLSVDAVPKLSGELNFTPSTLLVEFDPLAPSVERGPRRPPPYFSIRQPFMANWEFDLVATGDGFLQVRSPYFRALLSANLALGGSFIKPELVGGLRVASGDILFPAVRMELDSGEAFIEPTQPNEVQLDFSGIAQLSSYVVTMEVSQTLSDPVVYFSSTPMLPNSEIIRLLATGGLSGGEVGAVGVYLGKGLLGIGAGGIDAGLMDRLTIDVGEAGGRDGGNTFGIRYRITDRVYLNGGYDMYEAYNLNLLWSVFKR